MKPCLDDVVFTIMPFDFHFLFFKIHSWGFVMIDELGSNIIIVSYPWSLFCSQVHWGMESFEDIMPLPRYSPFLKSNYKLLLQLVLLQVDVGEHKFAGPSSPIPKHISNWKEYYEWRCIPLNSPVALLLHWVCCVFMWVIGWMNEELWLFFHAMYIC